MAPSRTEGQADLFSAPTVPAYRPDPDKVRARLHKILAEARPAPSRAHLPRTRPSLPAA